MSVASARSISAADKDLGCPKNSDPLPRDTKLAALLGVCSSTTWRLLQEAVDQRHPINTATLDRATAARDLPAQASDIELVCDWCSAASRGVSVAWRYTPHAPNYSINAVDDGERAYLVLDTDDVT